MGLVPLKEAVNAAPWNVGSGVGGCFGSGWASAATVAARQRKIVAIRVILDEELKVVFSGDDVAFP
jgi:hypothetical protein